MAGIYLHIPFCRKACHYCNFHFSTSVTLKAGMTAAMQREMELRKGYLTMPVDTIYLGGGTPSLLSAEELASLFSTLHRLHQVSADAEITIEANPDDIDETKLQLWRQLGINRLSIGVQSFNNNDLQWMNRSHSAAQSIRSIQLAQSAGFNNISIDLIYGLPKQSAKQWQEHLMQAFDLNVPHMSCYALTVEPSTALAHQIRKHPEWETDPEKQSEHFHLLMDASAAAGFEHYEISNFAQPGFRSRHNSSYWEGEPYLGIGPSAHSYNGQSRQWNVANNGLYLKSIEGGEVPFEMETLTVTQQCNEYIMTSLRTIEGISLTQVALHWGKDTHDALLQSAEKYLASAKMKLESEHLQLTKEGKFFADGIAADLFR